MSEAVPVAFMKTVWSSAIFQSNPWSICATGDSPGWTGGADGGRMTIGSKETASGSGLIRQESPRTANNPQQSREVSPSCCLLS
jgi:hypothetical protein